MLARSLWLTPLLCLAFVQAAGDDQAKKDLERMQGTWDLHALEIDGKEILPQQLDGTVLVVKGNEYHTKIKDKDLFGFRLQLDASKVPKEMDMIQKMPDGAEKTFKAIYTFENDEFKMARGLDSSQERPTQFATWPGTNCFVVTWKKREK